MNMTFDEYDKLIEKLKKVEGSTYWPEISEIDLMAQNPEKYIVFACYLLEHNNPPQNNAEKYSKRNLLDFVNRNLELTE